MKICAVRISFDAAHRIVNHQGKCANLHGHRYGLEVSLQSNQLDELGMVIDFADVKTPLKRWIDDNWDHTVILWEEDAQLGEAVSRITKQKIFYLPHNPTAENMAIYFKEVICPNYLPLSSKSAELFKVRIFETAHSYVEV